MSPRSPAYPDIKGQILRGDFTRPRTAHVTFDHVILPDGTAVEIRTDTTIGVSDVKTAQYLPKSQRPGVRQKMLLARLAADA